MTLVLTVSDTPDPDGLDAIRTGLTAFNSRHIGMRDREHLSVLIREREGDAPLGGLWGETGRGWLTIEFLYVPEDRRAVGLGTRLIRLAEQTARERGCIGAKVETWDFQAPDFYRKLGYRVFGELDDCPAGHRLYVLARRLD